MRTRPARTQGSGTDHSRSATAWLTLGLLALTMLANLAGAITSLVLLVEPNEAQLLFGSPVSDWFWGLSIVLFTSLTLVCAYVLRSVWHRDAGAGLAVSVLSLIGIGYSLLSITHGYGWAVLMLSMGMLAANQAATAQGYYSGHALSMRRA